MVSIQPVHLPGMRLRGRPQKNRTDRFSWPRRKRWLAMPGHSGRFLADVTIEAMIIDCQREVLGNGVAVLLLPEPTASP